MLIFTSAPTSGGFVVIYFVICKHAHAWFPFWKGIGIRHESYLLSYVVLNGNELFVLFFGSGNDSFENVLT